MWRIFFNNFRNLAIFFFPQKKASTKLNGRNIPFFYFYNFAQKYVIGCNNVLLPGSCSWVTGYCRWHCYKLWLVRGGVRAQDYGHHMDKPHLILTVELRGWFRSRLAPLDVAATVREKLFSSVRVQEQSVASFPRQSLLSSFAVRLPWLVSLFLSHFQGEAYEVLARYIFYIFYSFFRVSSSSSLTSFFF